MPAVQDDSQRDRRTTKRILAIGLPLVVIAGTGIGYAYWTSSGTGSGSATASNGVNVVVNVGAATGLAPGGFVDVPVSLDNPSATDLQVSSLSLTSIAPDAGHSACDATLSGVSTAVTNPGAASVPAGATAQPYGKVRVSMANSTSNQNACKGVIYTVAVAVN